MYFYSKFYTFSHFCIDRCCSVLLERSPSETGCALEKQRTFEEEVQEFEGRDWQDDSAKQRLSIKDDYCNSTPRTHTVERELTTTSVFWLVQVHCGIHTSICSLPSIKIKVIKQKRVWSQSKLYRKILFQQKTKQEKELTLACIIEQVQYWATMFEESIFFNFWKILLAGIVFLVGKFSTPPRPFILIFNIYFGLSWPANLPPKIICRTNYVVSCYELLFQNIKGLTPNSLGEGEFFSFWNRVLTFSDFSQTPQILYVVQDDLEPLIILTSSPMIHHF